ncbi:MAG: lysophospholipid acyltransferase family protein [Candidatus Bipolaricaulota bacterium]|nr:lysophospholipid acyltransferase family protein [Candidatus Bipolaricaulota bacterium]
MDKTLVFSINSVADKGGILRRLENVFIYVLLEIIWVFYAGFTFLILPFIAKTKLKGTLPDPPFILCATHVGNFDPLFIVRGTGRYRMRAIYQMDGPHPVIRLLFRAFWRFRVSQLPELRPSLNRRTMSEAVGHLKRGGTLMIFPEGYWAYEKKLYPGAAVMAHRANVPVVPVGIENGAVFRPGIAPQPFHRVVKRLIRDYRHCGRVTVHFVDPIYPKNRLEEGEDVDRLGRSIEASFNKFYRRFYNIDGPVWEKRVDVER